MKKNITLSILLSCLFVSYAYSEQGKAPQDPGKASQHGVVADDAPMKRAQTKLIADIRSDIVADKSLSTRAHNITIVSSSPSTVVLRGTVDNDAEKTKLVEAAKKHAPEVVDELKVK